MTHRARVRTQNVEERCRTFDRRVERALVFEKPIDKLELSRDRSLNAVKKGTMGAGCTHGHGETFTITVEKRYERRPTHRCVVVTIYSTPVSMTEYLLPL